ncbi:hypothetical protein ACIQVO_18020 [Streptomyces sp. NPDC101062]|uniref:hypothetical protein n=1 Tax=unclassified Streptomyces TaxID=2593676 RepID=UPI003826265C
MPYITGWSAERAPVIRVVEKARGIGYADEQAYDRDSDGVLWTRIPSLPGRGRPEFGRVHALRQRRAMVRTLCQVCGGPADRNEDGVLWMLGEDPADRGSWPDDLVTTHPPLCAPCAVQSVRVCPRLREQCVALRVRSFAPMGVRGALYRPGYPFPVPVDAVGVAFDDPRIHWVRAGQLVMRLREFTVVGLEALRTAGC